ncbi:hypothetical protein [Streptomyces sp. NPDC002276]
MRLRCPGARPPGGRFVLAQLLWCADADHARRVASLAARVQRRQLALAAEVAGAEQAVR